MYKMRKRELNGYFTVLILWGVKIFGKAEIYVVTLEGELVVSCRGGADGLEATTMDSDSDDKIDVTSCGEQAYIIYSAIEAMMKSSFRITSEVQRNSLVEYLREQPCGSCSKDIGLDHQGRVGIIVIQVDKAALREGFAFRKAECAFYLDLAIHSLGITDCSMLSR